MRRASTLLGVCLSAAMLTACGGSRSLSAMPSSSQAFSASGLSFARQVAGLRECPTIRRSSIQPYYVSRGETPDRCMLLSALTASAPVVFADTDIATAQRLLEVAEGASPASTAHAGDAAQTADPALQRYVVVVRAPNGPPLILESVGLSLDRAIEVATDDVAAPDNNEKPGDAWFQVLREERVVANRLETIRFETKYRGESCVNVFSQNTGHATFYHNVYRLISPFVKDDFYLADAWVVRPIPTVFANLPGYAFGQSGHTIACLKVGSSQNLGFVNKSLQLAQPLAIDNYTGKTTGSLYEWAPEKTPKSHVYRLSLGADLKFGKDKVEGGLSARYDIEWTVHEFSVTPIINGFVATNGEWNTSYWSHGTPHFFPPARDPFKATSTYEQGFTTEIPAQPKNVIYQDLTLPITAKYAQTMGILCPNPAFRSAFTCRLAQDFTLDGSSSPKVHDPVLAFQKAPGETYVYDLRNVCVEQREQGANPVTNVRLISQQFAPAQPIPIQYQWSGGGNPRDVEITDYRDPETFAIALRLRAEKSAHLDEVETFNFETKPKHVSPSTRFNPLRLEITIRKTCGQ
jgi:hypothetical protein